MAADGPGLPVRQANVAASPTRVSFEDHLRGDLWLLGYLPLRLRALRTDVYHGPAVFLPHVKLGYRTVVTIHDLVSFLFPETVPRKYSLYMRLMTRLAARSADRIIAVSEATKADLVRDPPRAAGQDRRDPRGGRAGVRPAPVARGGRRRRRAATGSGARTACSSGTSSRARTCRG